MRTLLALAATATLTGCFGGSDTKDSADSASNGGGGGGGGNDTALGYLALGADFNLGTDGNPTGGVGYYLAYGGTAEGAMPTGSPICDAHGNFNVHSDSWSAPASTSTDTATSTGTDTATDVLPTPACPDCEWAFVSTPVVEPAATGNCTGLLYLNQDGDIVDFGFDAIPGIFGYYAFGFQPTFTAEQDDGSTATFNDIVWMAFPTFNNDYTAITGHDEWSPWAYSYAGTSNVTKSSTMISFRSATSLVLYYTP
ncbi:MAG: hypothetical protein RLZZ299_336 [Pseudomonadota bacterium]|jgi:hypothetical protein